MNPAAGLTVATSRGDAVIVLDQGGADRDVADRGGPDRGRRPLFLLVLTHGAGGGVDAPDLLATRDAALAAGGAVARVVQPYRVRGSRAPGSVAAQDAAWLEIIAALREVPGRQQATLARAAADGGRTAHTSHAARTAHTSRTARAARAVRVADGGVPLIVGGRSNGARLACRTARAAGAAAVIALAFPMHPPGHPERSRRGELLAAGVGVLAISGSSDPFGVPGAADADQVVVLAGEGHSLSRHPAAVAHAVSGWLGGNWLSERVSRGR